MKVYISGPMRGIPRFNFPMFFDAERALDLMGATTFNPAAHDLSTGAIDLESEAYQTGNLDGTDFDLQSALRWDIARITESDSILLLPGWRDSKGVAVELAVADELGLGRLYWNAKTQQVDYEEPPWVSARYVTYPDPNHPAVPDVVYTVPSTRPVVEHRVVDEETGGAKGSKLARFDLLPWDALWVLAEHFGRGAEKYEERNWERGYRWSLNFAALQRHLTAFWNGEDFDAETGSLHITAVAWHALALLTFQLRSAGTDDRPGTVEL